MNEIDQKKAELSGIKIPKSLIKLRQKAQTELDQLKVRIADLREKVENLDPSLLQEEETRLVASSKDTGKIREKISLIKQERDDATSLLSRLEGLIPEFETKVTEPDLEGYCNQEFIKQRAEMEIQLDRVLKERAESAASSRDGFHSSPPAKQSKSRIAVCECCKNPIGVFDPETICLPIKGCHFEKLPRFDYDPFLQAADLPFFKCPTCGRVPFMERDKILTSAGYFAVDEKKTKTD
jgi:hypothetical protein